jgi:Spherulation-specific family 4
MSMIDKPPDEWMKIRRRVQRQNSPGMLRALASRPVTAVVIAAVVVLGAAVGVTEGLSSGGTGPSRCQRAFVPAYFDQGTWSQATASRPAPSAMILNPATGTGAGTAPNPAYRSVVRQAQAEGTTILGYSSTASGQRPVAQIEADVRNYRSWYGVTGIFLDSVNGVTSELPYYERLASYIHRVIPGSSVWLNPGIYPDQQYMAVGDVLMVFEGTYAQYLASQVPSWAHAFPAARFANTIYAAASSSEASSVISLSRSRNAGYVYVTNLAGSDPYNALPSYWSSENAAITTGCGHGSAMSSALSLT